MAQPVPLACRWPAIPFWELDGFNFTQLRRSQHFNTVRGTLYKKEFTTSSTSGSNRPSRGEYSIRVRNNVAVHFLAMLYCKDSFSQQTVFWQRVQLCGLEHGSRVAEAIGDIFVNARKTFLRRGSTSPPRNEAARLVDEWIFFLDSRCNNPRLDTPPSVPWETRYREWAARKARGELIDAGQTRIRPAETMRNGTAWDGGVGARSTAMLLGSRDYPISVEIKQEPSTSSRMDITDDASLVDLGSSRPQGFKERNKRKGMESPSSRPAKRRTNKTSRANITSPLDQRQLQSPPPSSPSAAAPVAPKKSTKSRVAECEEKLVEHKSLTLNQDLRIGSQEDRIAQHAIKINSLDSRLKSIEENSSPIEDLRQSISELTSKQQNRDTYIRSEVRQHWSAVQAPFSQDQNRLRDRVDSLGSEVVVQKVRLEDVMKTVDEHSQKVKEGNNALSLLEGTLTKKIRVERRRISEINAKLDEVEGRLNNDKPEVRPAADTSPVQADSPEVSQLEKRLDHLSTRVAKLERRPGPEMEHQKRQWTAIDNILGRLKALETAHSELKTTSIVNRAALDERITRQGERLGRQERTSESLRKEVSNVHTELQSTYQTHTPTSYMMRQSRQNGHR